MADEKQGSVDSESVIAQAIDEDFGLVMATGAPDCSRPAGMVTTLPDADASVPDDQVDAERYRKLRAFMGRNQKASWDAIERLAAVACYVGVDHFDAYLDDNMGEGPEKWDVMESGGETSSLDQNAAPKLQ
jgi:hypothetical protein